MSTPLQEVHLPLAPSQEEELLRESVRGVASQYGAKYMIECFEEGRPPAELWDAIAQKGLSARTSRSSTAGAGLA